MSPEVQKNLDEAVLEAYRNAVSNGYDLAVTEGVNVVALDMMELDAAVESLITEHDLQLEDVARSVALAREVVDRG